MSKIEIDLNDLGLMDEDGRSPTIRELVIERAVLNLLSPQTDIVREVQEKVQAEAQTQITAKVSEVLEGPISETTRWGEPKRTTSVKEIIREALEVYLNKPGRQDRTYGSRDPQNLRELIEDHTRNVLNAELRKEIDKAKAQISETVTQAALKEAVKIIEAKGGK